MNQFFYNGLFKLLSPFVLLWYYYKTRNSHYAWQLKAPERFGRYKNKATRIDEIKDTQELPFKFKNPVWINSISLGETRAVYPLVKALLDLGYPVLLTHMTPAGWALGEHLFSEEKGQGRLCQTWLPYDLKKAVHGFIDHWQPRCGILIEKKFWPNLVLGAKEKNVPMIFASVHFSEESFNRLSRLGKIMRETFEAFDLILTQTREDVLQLSKYKIPKMLIGGNIRFDMPVPSSLVHRGQVLKEQIQRPVVVLASIHNMEEQLFIEALTQPIIQKKIKENNTLYVLAPRYLVGIKKIKSRLKKHQINYALSSDLPTDAELKTIDVLLVDKIGELFTYYALSDLALIGGSFANYGGHNLIEASLLEKPVIVGPYMQNYEQIVEDAIVEGAARRAETAMDALDLAETLLQDPYQLRVMSASAKQWLNLYNGATEKIVEAILPYLNRSSNE